MTIAAQGTEPRRVVVVGASGFVGRHVRHAAAGARHDVTVISRKPLQLLDGERAAPAGLDRVDALSAALPRQCSVVNLAYDGQAGHAANMALADAIADVCIRSGAERLVHVSTAMVAGLAQDRWVTEQSVARPVTPYQRTKLAIEERLGERLRGRCSLVVLRPTAVFGAGGLNLKKLVSDLGTRPWYENYARACLFGTRPMNLVPVETVAAAVMFAVGRPPETGDGLYLVADDEADENNFRDVEAVLRREMRLPSYPFPRVPLPMAMLAGALRATGRLSFDPRTRFSSARLLAAGFVRPVEFAGALRAYAAAARDARPTGAHA